MNFTDAPLPDLHDIHVAPTPPWWPPAPGWWLSAILLMLLTILVSYFVTRCYRRWRRKQYVLALLQQLLATRQGAQFAAELSILLRRVALTRFPRQQFAGLSGKDWLAFLDQTGGDGLFSDGPGTALLESPYQRQANIECEQLYQLAYRWIKKNL